MREKEILQKELALCQRQLKESNENIADLKKRLSTVEDAHQSVRKDYSKATKELEQKRDELLKKDIELQKLETSAKTSPGAEEGTKKTTSAPSSLSSSPIAGRVGARVSAFKEKEPAGWRWEKQELERQVKDLKKRVDDLTKEQQKTKRLGSRGSLTGSSSSLSGDEKSSDTETLKKDMDTLKNQLKETTSRIEEIQSTKSQLEVHWSKEKEILETDRCAALKEASQKDDIIKQKDDIIRQKDDLIRQRESFLTEKAQSVKSESFTLSKVETELQEATKLLSAKEKSIDEVNIQLRKTSEKLNEIQKKLRDSDEIIRLRDERLKEKDEALAKLNRTLSEKESSQRDMDQSIRQAMKKLNERESEMKSALVRAEKAEKEALELGDKMSNVETGLERTMKDRDKETANLVIYREKLENQLEFVEKEKKSLVDELLEARRALQHLQEDFQRERTRYENELGKSRERIHSLESKHSSSSGRAESSSTINLISERDSLVKEKQRLDDINRKLRSELEKSRSCHESEVSNLNHKVQENRREIEEKVIETNRLQREVSILKEQLAKGASSRAASESRSTPSISSPTSPSIGSPSPPVLLLPSSTADPTKLASFDRQELIYKAEKAGLEELFESRLKVYQNQLDQLQTERDNLKRENSTQKELLIGSSKTLTEMKTKYEDGNRRWISEKHSLARKTQEHEISRRRQTELERQVELQKSEIRKLHEMLHDKEKKLKIERKEIDAEKAELKAKKKKKRDASKDREETGEKKVTKILKEVQETARDIRDNYNAAESKKDQQIKELLDKVDENRREYFKEKKELLDQHLQAEERAKQVAPLQRTVVDMKYKLHLYRESWLRERSELQHQVDDARRQQLEEKQRLVHLTTEVRKVRTLMPVLQPDPESVSRTSEISRGHSEITLPEKKMAASVIDQSLDSICKLTDEIGQPPTVRRRIQKRSVAPPAFRRSLSMSEADVEMNIHQQGLEERVESSTAAPQLQLAPPQKALLKPSPVRRQLSTPSSIADRRSPSPGNEGKIVQTQSSSLHVSMTTLSESEAENAAPARDQVERRARPVMRRSHSTATSDAEQSYPTKSLDRASRYSTPRNSMYASGTQSACASRDPSPDSEGLRYRKLSPYPAPPPSFLVTPPRSPGQFGTSSTSRSNIFTSANLMKLYEKLGEIDVPGDGYESDASVDGFSVSKSAAIAKERTGAVRVLVKSMSVDGAEEEPPWDVQEKLSALPQRLSYIESKKESDVFVDAPLSQTLPASIRIGSLLITPGVEQLSRQTVSGPTVYKAKGVLSPKTARKKFYDEYSQTYDKIKRGPSRKKIPAPPPKETKPKTMPMEPIYATIEPRVSKDATKVKDEKSLVSRATAFFGGKDKRKMFGSKKATSVDSANVESSLAKVGVQATATAAPHSLEPALRIVEPIPGPIQTTKPKSKEKDKKDDKKKDEAKTQKRVEEKRTDTKLKSHTRAKSIDIPSIFKTSSSTAPPPPPSSTFTSKPRGGATGKTK